MFFGENSWDFQVQRVKHQRTLSFHFTFQNLFEIDLNKKRAYLRKEERHCQSN